MASGADVVFNTIVPPGRDAVLRAAARRRLRRARRPARLHVLRRELPQPDAGRARARASTAASTTTRPSTIRSAGSCSRSTTRSTPATRSSPAAAPAPASTAACGSGRRPCARPASLDQADVIAALDHAEIAEAPAARPRWCPASTTCACTCTSPRRATAASRSSRASARSTRRSAQVARTGARRLTVTRVHPTTTHPRKENDMLLATTTGRGPRPVHGGLLDAGAEKRQQHGSKGATIFRDPDRGGSRLGHLRLGRGGLAELRLRPGGAADHAGGRAQVEAGGGAARRPLRRLSRPARCGGPGIQVATGIARETERASNRGPLLPRRPGLL